MTQELIFNFKEMFDTKEKLDRLILKLAIARSDMLHVHNRHIQVLDNDSMINSGESLYLFRLAISHLREIVKLITFGSKDKEVMNFVRKIYKDIEFDFNRFVMTKEDSFLCNVLIPTRNNLFHYYDKDKDLEFEEKLIEMNDFETRILVTTDRIKDIEYEFADQIALLISIGDISYDEFKELAKQVASYMVSFSKVAEFITGEFFQRKKEGGNINRLYNEDGNIS